MKTVKQLAAELNVSKSTLHRLIHKLKQERIIETIQRDNKLLLDDSAEKAIIQALKEKALQGETIQNDSETVQKRFKNESETNQRNDFQKQYIDSLLSQIEELKADKERIYNDYESEKKERQTMLINLLDLQKENESIKIELDKYKSLVDSKQTVKAEPRPKGAATRQEPKQPQRPQKKKSWLDIIFRR